MRRLLPLWLYCGAISGLLASLARNGWTATWQALMLPTMSPSFADMRVVRGAVLAARSGLDPLVSRLPDSPFPMNYPSIWVAIGEALNLPVESHFIAFCSFVLACFVGAGAYMLYRFPSYALLACLLSTATLLGMERGNTDLIVYGLVLLFAVGAPRAVALVPLLVATVLKLYPVFCLGALLIRQRYRPLLIGLVGAGLIFVALRHELSSIRAVTLSGSSFVISFGFANIADYFTERQLSSNLFVLLTAAIAVVTLALALVWLRCRNWPAALRFPAAEATQPASLDLFLAGACIYVGTFIFSSNWDYRLIFLVPCVPFLLAARTALCRGLVVLIVVAMNEIVLRRLGVSGVAVVWAAKIGLFVVLCAHLAAQAVRAVRNSPSSA